MVVSTSKALRQWSAISDRRDLDVDLTDCLDKAAGVGLGISLAKPGSKVLVLDTDATLRTNPNAMVTTATVAPDNLVHFSLKTATMSLPAAHPYLGWEIWTSRPWLGTLAMPRYTGLTTWKTWLYP